ncbi:MULTISPECIES: aminotransferase class IV [unclassified Streptomyces]|uniref:aminotransferase class IV n=1 Tax=unclassified Streptomyces TaxID=2593676 RepID=UPI002E27CF10|nr:aminotransferase class IV [Streptomyces sp. NBC_00223]
MTQPSSPLIEIDGAPATVETLAPVLGGYGHFTAMQVRDGRVRGLRFHLARLDGATRELFGTPLDGERVRAYVRHALASARAADPSRPADASVRVNVFQPADVPGTPVAVMVAVRQPAAMPEGPYRVKSVPYLRPVAHLKHVGGFAQGYFGRQVAAEGYQEALLTGPDGGVAEGAITNIGFVAGDTVVWPQGPQLRGITWQVLEEVLNAVGVPQVSRPVGLADVGTYDGAFVVNSRGTATVSRIDDTPVPMDAELLGRVAKLYESAPWDEI